MKRKNKRNENLNIIKCKGINIANFINLCTVNGMSLQSMIRTEDNYVEFGLTDRDLAILNKLDTKNYEYDIIKIGGIKRVFNTFIYRIGLVIGLVISIVAMFMLNNRLFRIHIYGLTNTSHDVVVEKVNEYGINLFSSLDFDLSELENYLSNEFDFSMVSIITKGNSLIISVKEELPDISESYAPITADYNMIITSIKVYSGTGKVKSGDIVYKGDTLVEPFIESSGDIVYVSPCADIVAKVYFGANYKFKTSEEVMVRTGNKKIISSEIKFGKYTISKTDKLSDYVNYELETIESIVSQYFLPITINKTYAYELELKLLERNFEEEKDKLISQVKDEAYEQVPSSLNVSNEEIVITEISSGYIINVYLECDVEFNYKYNN